MVFFHLRSSCHNVTCCHTVSVSFNKAQYTNFLIPLIYALVSLRLLALATSSRPAKLGNLCVLLLIIHIFSSQKCCATGVQLDPYPSHKQSTVHRCLNSVQAHTTHHLVVEI